MGKHKASEGIVRVSAIFSSVQVVTILCGVVRSKLVALWIGATGIGLFGVFNSALDMLGSLTRLSIDQSGVRDISQHREAGRKWKTAVVVERWGMILALFGALLMMGLSPLLSRVSFGNESRWWQFGLLSIALGLNTLTATNRAVMQGLREFRRLARLTVWGSVIGVAVSVPMFYFWGVDSILPALIAYSVITWGVMMKLRVRKPEEIAGPTFEETRLMGGSFIRLGAFMTISALAAFAANYVFISWLTTTGSLTDTGYYQSGYTLFNRYAGLVLAALGVEYFPRLASAAQSRWRMGTMVGHEISLLTWLFLPLITVFAVLAPWIVELLYSGEFEVIVPFVSIAMTGNLLRGVSWCMAFTILARGDGRTYLLTEITSAAVGLTLNIMGWKLWGLAGLGGAFVLTYLVYTAVMFGVLWMRYGILIRWKTLLLTGCGLVVCGGLTVAVLLGVSIWLTGFVALTVSVTSAIVLKRKFL